MTSLAQTISVLQSRRENLVREIADIERRLAAVTRALGTPRARLVKGRGSRAAKGGRRAWFAHGETAKLLRRVARTPKPPADLVRDIATIKGYADHLSSDEMRRFQGAAFMAIEHAVKVGTLKRRKDGRVSAA